MRSALGIVYLTVFVDLVGFGIILPLLPYYAESFGAKGYRVGSADELLPTLRQAVADDTVVLIDCPVDYAENMKLTAELGELVCPI